MKALYTRLALGALLVAGFSITACTNENGVGGVSDGNAGEAYELRNKDHLAPSMDSLATDSATAVKEQTPTMGTPSGE